MLKDKLKNYRKLNKLKQDEFAKMLGISRTYLSDLENGRANGNLKILLKLSSATDTPLEIWLDENTDTSSIENTYNLYSVLDTFIENLISAGEINEKTGEISKEYIPSILNILTAEIKLKLQKKRRD